MALPLIDLSAAPADDTARAIDAALRSAGFFAVTGHGVSPTLGAAAFDAGQHLREMYRRTTVAA